MLRYKNPPLPGWSILHEHSVSEQRERERDPPSEREQLRAPPSLQEEAVHLEKDVLEKVRGKESVEVGENDRKEDSEEE